MSDCPIKKDFFDRQNKFLDKMIHRLICYDRPCIQNSSGNWFQIEFEINCTDFTCKWEQFAVHCIFGKYTGILFNKTFWKMRTKGLKYNFFHFLSEVSNYFWKLNW